MKKYLMLLAVCFCVTNSFAVLIGSFPGLEKLIGLSDAIVILRVDRQLSDVVIDLYAAYDCMIYQTLKGEIPTGKTVRLQLMDTRTAFVNPYAIHSAHLVFLTKRRSASEPTEYRTIEIQGANVRLTPFGNEQLLEGKTIEERVKTLLRRTGEYDRQEFQKEQDFLQLMLSKGPTPVRKK